MSAAPSGSMVHGPKAAPRHLPSLDRLLRHDALASSRLAHGSALVTALARSLLAERRALAAAGELPIAAAEPDALAHELARRVDAHAAPRLRRVVNLTGTVIHTNLGRAPLAEAAMARLQAAAGASNLEYDLGAGTRGERDSLVEPLLCELTGAEAATVVNNNAAAVLLVIAALARGREVIVSRGELVEIGGAFRMPDVMASAGATLVEVGTTNRTHLADYERAITERTALILKVHTSNYAVTGFTTAVSEAELAPLARARGIPLATDLGSGALIDLAAHGLPREPMVQDALRDGCDVVTFSGDKLLGGPQAGLIVGSHACLDRIRRCPMKRALRLSKLPFAALEATLALYRDPDRLAQRLPTLRLLTRPIEAIRADADALREPLAGALGDGWTVTVADVMGQIGSGSLPVERLPSVALAVAPVGAREQGRRLETLASALRALPLPLISRIAEGRLLLDLRALEDRADILSQLTAFPTLPQGGKESGALPPLPQGGRGPG